MTKMTEAEFVERYLLNEEVGSREGNAYLIADAIWRGIAERDIDPENERSRSTHELERYQLEDIAVILGRVGSENTLDAARRVVKEWDEAIGRETSERASALRLAEQLVKVHERLDLMEKSRDLYANELAQVLTERGNLAPPAPKFRPIKYCNHAPSSEDSGPRCVCASNCGCRETRCLSKGAP